MMNEEKASRNIVTVIDKLRTQNEGLKELVDLLAHALVEHNHTWTDKERALYDKEIKHD